MKNRNQSYVIWITTGVLFVLQIPALLWLDGTELSEQKRRTDPFATKLNVPPEYLAGYLVGNLFGAFKQVAIDYFWIKYKRLKDQKRYEEAVALLQALSILQPNRDRIWEHLGWDISFNVSKKATNKEQEWQKIMEGMKVVKQGMERMPNSYRLRLQAAQIYYKRIPQEKNFMERVWQKKRKGGKRQTTYGISVNYLKQGRKIAADQNELPFYRSRYGLMVTYSFYDLIYLIHYGQFERALNTISEKKSLTLDLINDTGGMENTFRPYRDYYRTYDHMPDIIRAEQKLASIPRKKREKRIQATKKLAKKYGRIFHQYPLGGGKEAAKHIISRILKLLYYVDQDLRNYYRSGRESYLKSGQSLFADTVKPLVSNLVSGRANTAQGMVKMAGTDLGIFWEQIKSYYETALELSRVEKELRRENLGEEQRKELASKQKSLERDLETIYVKFMGLYNSKHWGFRQDWFKEKIDAIEETLNFE